MVVRSPRSLMDGKSTEFECNKECGDYRWIQIAENKYIFYYARSVVGSQALTPMEFTWNIFVSSLAITDFSIILFDVHTNHHVTETN